MEMAKPQRLQRENHRCSPTLWPSRILWAGKAIDIGSVMGDVLEQAQVACDQVRLVGCPDRELGSLDDDRIKSFLFWQPKEPPTKLLLWTHNQFLGHV